MFALAENALHFLPLLLVTLPNHLVDAQFSSPLPAPSGVPFPSSDYPNATSPAVPSNLFNATSPPFYPSPWMDGSGGWAQAYERAQAFVRQLTLEEKVNLTTGVGWEGEACVGNVGSIPRLGFQALCMQDSPLGVRDSDYTSGFLAGGTIAMSWDRDLMYQRGNDMGMEHRGKGVDVQLGPVVGPIGRSPEGGRNWEGFSPDPVLSGIAVAQTIRGIQDAGVMSCTKHFIGYEQEHFREVPEAAGYGYNISDSVSSNIDDTTMHELYLWPFADAVRANTTSLMCSYNQINNSYASQNSHTLNYLLKGELGFQGFVMSDWGAQQSGVSGALAGLDMAMPGDTAFNSGRSYWGSNLTLAVLNGTVPEFRLDDMATRIMAGYFLVGRDRYQIPVNFNSWSLDTFGPFHLNGGPDYGYGTINYHVDVRAEHGNNIRDAAARSTVLLKNLRNTLPLTGREKFTATFGSDMGQAMYGVDGCSDRGCDNGTLAMGWGSGTANFPYLVTPNTAIQNEVLMNDGIFQGITDDYAYTQIQSLAQQATVAIVGVNADSGEGYINVDGNLGDRKNLTLWHDGETLIRNVSANCNNTIVVIHSVGAVLLNTFVDNPNVTAIVWAGLPGQQSGNSLADVLYGRVNPSGKLTFTLGASREDYGTDVLYNPNNGMAAPQDDFEEGVFIDYRAFDRAGITPIYEFGFGLSYTNFSMSNLTVVRHASGPYTPSTGMTNAAPILGNNTADLSAYVCPANQTRVPEYIYPCINSTDATASYGGSDYAQGNPVPAGALDGSPQPRIAAGGGPGGNPQLYNVLYTVTAVVTNTGSLPGEEVAQLYISLGGPNQPVKVLRGFDKLSIQPGKSATFSADITRRDISNWDTVSQNWVISNYTKTVYVGNSSRKLPLSAKLPM